MSKTVVSCGAVVYRSGPTGTEILLVKQADTGPSWGIPKGHMEPGETYINTAIREVKEETGITIRVITRLPHVILQKRRGKKIVIPYLAFQTCQEVPRCDDKMSEVVDVRWFNIDDLPSIYLYQQPIIDAAVLMLQGFIDA